MVRIIVGVIFTIIGIPGMFDDLSAWQKWFAMLNPAWSGVMVGIGVATIFLWAFGHAEKWWKRRRYKTAMIDQMTATYIVARYIDPEDTMNPGPKISIPPEILAKFETIPGAKIGENYNQELLHQWMQKTMARVFVKNRGEMG